MNDVNVLLLNWIISGNPSANVAKLTPKVEPIVVHCMCSDARVKPIKCQFPLSISALIIKIGTLELSSSNG